MFGFAPPVPVAKIELKKEGPPGACIRRSEDKTYCDRAVDEDKEFVFKDAAYAARVYHNSNTIRACAECVRRYNAGAGRLDTQPMATRGINEVNDK